MREIDLEIKEEEFDINGTHDSDDYSHIKSLQQPASQQIMQQLPMHSNSVTNDKQLLTSSDD